MKFKLTTCILSVILLFGCAKDDFENSSAAEQEILSIGKEYGINLKTDKSIAAQNSLEFENFESFRDFLTTISTEQLDYWKVEYEQELKKNIETLRGAPCNGWDWLSRVKVKNTGFAQLNIHTSIENGRVREVNTRWSGITLGLDFEPTGYYSYRSGNNVVLTTSGLIQYTVFISGIGVLYEDPVTWKVVIPCGGGPEKVYEVRY